MVHARDFRRTGFVSAIRWGVTMIFRKMLADRNGATAIEYGLISAIMAVALLSGFGAFSNALNTQFTYLAGLINY